MAGPLLKSLIAQLIPRFNFNFDFIEREPDYSNLNNAAWLCWCFENMLQQLANGTVIFLILDNTSHFESYRLLSDTKTVFGNLFSMTGFQYVVLKILVTSRYRSNDIARLMGVQHILNIPEFVDGSRQGVLATDRSGVRENLEMISNKQRQMRRGW